MSASKFTYPKPRPSVKPNGPGPPLQAEPGLSLPSGAIFSTTSLSLAQTCAITSSPQVLPTDELMRAPMHSTTHNHPTSLPPASLPPETLLEPLPSSVGAAASGVEVEVSSLSSSSSSSSGLAGSSVSRREKRKSEDYENWEDVRGYMKAKRRKLQDQFDSLGPPRSSIFEGVTIYVNGWTRPSSDELKRMIHAHGGNYVLNTPYGAKPTHVIATNLPDTKVKNLGDTVVCRPDWIVDSIASGCQLPVHDYRLYVRTRGQRSLGFEKAFPTLAVASLQETGLESAVECPSDRGGLERAGESRGKGKAIEMRTPELSLSNRHKPHPLSSPTGSSATSAPIPKVPIPVPSAPVPNALPYQPSKGAEFVSEFYTHSRLHHLSTWSTELKQFTSEMIARGRPQKHPKLPRDVSLRAQNERAVVHIDLDCFFVSVSIRDRPNLRGKPIAVTHARRGHNPGLSGAAESANESKPLASLTSPEAVMEWGKPEPHAHTSSMSGDSSLTTESHSAATSHHSHGTTAVAPGKHRTLLDSMSDIASCSYEAREAGVRNGMQVGRALKLCPSLQFVPYDFQRYRETSQVFYETLLSYSTVIEAVSCDEAYLELTDYVQTLKEAETIVREMRAEVEAKTGCTVSAGIAQNMLLARMSTRKAKPDGQHLLTPEEVDAFLSPQSVRDLPGVGRSLDQRLREMSVETCGQLKALPLLVLQTELGTKTGLMLHEYSRGVDTRSLKLTTERKSLSADINYGIRFSSSSEAESLLRNLSAEVERRAREANVLGGTVTLKLKIRRRDAPLEARKYLGHGACDNVSRSFTLLEPTQSSAEIAKMSIQLLKQVKAVPSDIRGVGIQLTRLVSADDDDGGTGPTGQTGQGRSGDLRSLFRQQNDSGETVGSKTAAGNASSSSSSLLTSLSTPPLPNLIPQIPTTSQFLANPSSSFSSAHTHQAAPPQPESVARGAKSSIMDESFMIDLPPASQLDSSVLTELPLPLQEKILEGYSKKSSHNSPKSAIRDDSKQNHEKSKSKSADEKHRRLVSLGSSPSRPTRGRGGRGRRGRGRPAGSRSLRSESTVTLSALLSPLKKAPAPPTVTAEGQPASRDTSKRVAPDSDGGQSQEIDGREKPILIKDDSAFLADARDYLTDWVAHFPEGPVSKDTDQVENFLIRLSRTNLFVVLAMLKFFRRLIFTSQSISWFPVFNGILSVVQETVKTTRGGTLAIESIPV